MDSKNEIISKLSLLEDINELLVKKNIKSFEKLIKSEIKLYDKPDGLEDYKLSIIDYNILYILYINTNSSPFKIQLLLYFMYSYYKLDGIDFNYKFPFKLFFDFLRDNNNIHHLIINLITII